MQLISCHDIYNTQYAPIFALKRLQAVIAAKGAEEPVNGYQRNFSLWHLRTALLPGLCSVAVAPLVAGNSVVGAAAEAVLGRPADVDVLVVGGGLTESLRAVAVRDVAGNSAGADVNVASVRRLPVRRRGRLVGKRQLGLALLNGLGVGAIDTSDGAM